MPYTPPPGSSSGEGSGDGADTVARARANQAYSLASSTQTGLQNHQASETPHKAYDEEIPDLTLIFQNGLI